MAGIRKVKPRKRSSRNKPSRAQGTVSEYLADVPKSARGNFVKLRAAIRSSVPEGATETISYGIPAIRYNGILVWYAAFAKHCSLFPTAAVIDEFKNELKGFSTSKGTIHFPNDRPLPVGLVKKLVTTRVKLKKS